MTEGGIIDIATALDTTLEHPTIEEKFHKLRLLSAEKIKSLLGTIDIQVKKLKEYREAPSDGRTATIKALKSKLKDQEFISDILKEDILLLRNQFLEKNHDNHRLSIRDINQDVIDETIGGPKRFRQLTREEIENNLIELEVLEKQYREQPRADKRLTTKERAAAARAARTKRIDIEDDVPAPSPLRPSSSNADYRMRELQKQQRDEDLRAQENKIANLLDEMERIRADNAKHRVRKENSVFNSKNYEELTISMNRMTFTLKDVEERLQDSKKELSDLKSKQFSDADTIIANIERARKELSVVANENSDLLVKMKDIELELDRLMDGKLYGDDAEDARIASQESDAELAQLEQSLTKQWDEVNERKKLLQERSSALGDLRRQLREKNEEYRILKRDMAEVARVKLSPGKVVK